MPRRERLEKKRLRLALVPFLQAEDDRRYVRDRARSLERERKVMANVPGWVVGESVYKTRFMRPTNPVMLMGERTHM